MSGIWRSQLLIEDVIDLFPAELSPDPWDENLAGFILDLEQIISEHALFDSVDLSVTTDPRCTVQARVMVSRSAESLSDVSKALSEVWKSTYYNHFQCGSISWYRDRTELRFITVHSSEQYCITGRIIATAPHQTDLVRRFEQDFVHPDMPSPILE